MHIVSIEELTSFFEFFLNFSLKAQADRLLAVYI